MPTTNAPRFFENPEAKPLNSMEHLHNYASQFAIQYMSVAMQLRFCIAVGCDAKTAVVLSIYLFFIRLFIVYLF
jgi:hypothetical protein